MEKFNKQFDTFQRGIFATEVDPLTSTLCSCKKDIRSIRCLDCRQYAPTCASCFLKSHIHCFDHWAHVWNGHFFEARDISTLGAVLTLCHNGASCPCVSYTKGTKDFTLVAVNGIHRTRLAFCECPKAPKELDQLIQNRIFPATTAAPGIGFTFELLEDFHIHTLCSKKGGYDYLHAIRCKTNRAAPHDVPVCLLILLSQLTLHIPTVSHHSVSACDSLVENLVVNMAKWSSAWNRWPISLTLDEACAYPVLDLPRAWAQCSCQGGRRRL
jgi:hypothetical protein